MPNATPVYCLKKTVTNVNHDGVLFQHLQTTIPPVANVIVNHAVPTLSQDFFHLFVSDVR